MNRNHPDFKIQRGGLTPQTVRIYCGAEPEVPPGRVRGNPNQCYKSGLRSGFRAGIDQEKKRCIKRAKTNRAVTQHFQGLTERQHSRMLQNLREENERERGETQANYERRINELMIQQVRVNTPRRTTPPLPKLQPLSLGVLRSMLNNHLDNNPELPRNYLVESGKYAGRMMGLSYLGKKDYIRILKEYGLGV